MQVKPTLYGKRAELDPLKDEAINQIDRALSLFKRSRDVSKHDDISDQDVKTRDKVRTVMAATLIRLSPPGSVYLKTVDGFPNRLAGSLEALDEYDLECYQVHNENIKTLRAAIDEARGE